MGTNQVSRAYSIGANAMKRRQLPMLNRSSCISYYPNWSEARSPQPAYWGGYPPYQQGYEQQQPAMPYGGQMQGGYPPYYPPMYPVYPPQYGPYQQPSVLYQQSGSPYSPNGNRPPKAQSLNPFANPLQPVKQAQQAPTANPYPKQQFKQKNQTGGFSSMLNQFKTQDGAIDVNKMMSTAGQMMNTVNQVSSMVKGMGSLFTVKV